MLSSESIVSPYAIGHDHEERVIVTGCDVPIGGSAATGLALLLHEFATNAAKFGALSSPGGHIEVDCSVENAELRLTWAEHGGPALDGPAASEGFGSLLAQSVVTKQFAGQIARAWEPQGLILRLTLAMERLGA